jgi:hypothetical protein
VVQIIYEKHWHEELRGRRDEILKMIREDLSG